jgi:TatD DNase family protein
MSALHPPTDPRPVDAHVHGPVDRTRVLALRCLTLHEALVEGEADDGPRCCGLHPWDVTPETWENDLRGLEALLEAGRLHAVGETGLDRSRGPAMDLQRAAFLEQIDLSERHRLPLVVHAVRSGSDLLEIVRSRRPHQPWILHDWNGPPEQAFALLARSDAVFSFGANLVRGAPRARASAERLPLERILIETDNSRHDIGTVELALARLRGVDPQDLRDAFHRTWARLFSGTRH